MFKYLRKCELTNKTSTAKKKRKKHTNINSTKHTLNKTNQGYIYI